MRVSVITPTYNRAQYIQYAIDSFFEQDYPDKELVIVNDGSSDETENVILNNDNKPGLWYIKNERNLGQGASQNVGIEQASGELICTLDDDDALHGPRSLSDRVRMFEEDQGLEFVYTSGQDMQQNGYPSRINPCQHKTVLDEWRGDNIYINSCMFKKDIKSKIGGYYFDENLTSNEDWDFKLRCMIHCKYTCKDILTVWHRCYAGMRSAQHRGTGELQNNERLMREKLSKLYGGMFHG